MKIYCETQVPWPSERPYTDQNERRWSNFKCDSTGAGATRVIDALTQLDRHKGTNRVGLVVAATAKPDRVWMLAATFFVLHALVNHVRDEAKKRENSAVLPLVTPRIHVNDKGEQFRMGGAGLVKLREGIDFPGDGQTERGKMNFDDAAERHTAIWAEGEMKWRRVSKYPHGVTVTIETEALTLLKAQAVASAVDAALYEALDDIDAKAGGTNAE